MTSVLEEHDSLFFDLDGTLFLGATPVLGAPEALSDAAARGHRIAYLTNNGSRSAAQVGEHLCELGFTARAPDVVTSGQAAASILAELLPAGSVVLVVGTESLATEVTERGLRTTDRAEDAAGVVQGHSPGTGWPLLAEACVAIRSGALWVACNVDATLPTERGELPGNGSMVAALRTATGAEPVVAGKPERWLFTEALRRTGATRALVVGDRLDTDIGGANAAGLASLHVLTGVSRAADVLAATEPLRPRYLGADLAGLHTDAELARPVLRAPWRVHRDGDGLLLGTDDDAEDAEPVGALRALCEVHWAGGGGPVPVRADGEVAGRALRELGLASGARDGEDAAPRHSGRSASVAGDEPGEHTTPGPARGTGARPTRRVRR